MSSAPTESRAPAEEEARPPSPAGRAWPRRLGRALLLLLAVQLGVVLGLLGGRLRQRAAAPATVPQGTGGPAAAPQGQGPIAPAASGKAGKAAASPGAATLLVDVLDGAGAPLKGVVVFAQPIDERGLPAGAPAGLLPEGELGVLKGRLPLTGEVIAGSAAGREIVPGASVRAVTDDKGTARLVGLPAGRLQVQCTHLGGAASAEVVVKKDAGVEAAAHLVLRLGAAAPQASLAPEAPALPEEGAGPILGAVRDLQGVVLDERGLGLGRARVEAQGGEGQRVRRSTGTDSAGRFTLVAVPAGPVTILCQHPGFAPLSVTPDEDALRGPLRLQLQPGAGFEGLVRERRLGGLPERLRLVLSAGALRVPIAFGRDGRFRQTGLPPGEATLRAEAPGHVTVERRLQLPAGDHPDAVTLRDIVLDMELAGAVAGQVRDGRGPIGRAQLRALDEGGAEVGRAQSDAEGRFRLGSLPPGRLRIEARAQAGHAAETVEVRGGDESRIDLEIRE